MVGELHGFDLRRIKFRYIFMPLQYILTPKVRAKRITDLKDKICGCQQSKHGVDYKL